MTRASKGRSSQPADLCRVADAQMIYRSEGSRFESLRTRPAQGTRGPYAKVLEDSRVESHISAEAQPASWPAPADRARCPCYVENLEDEFKGRQL